MLIAVTTSMLVFIGGVELQRAAAHNNDISQTIWCWIYFVIAFASFHGGLVVLTPAQFSSSNIMQAYRNIVFCQ